MFKFNCAVVVVFFAYFIEGKVRDLPAYFPVCKRNPQTIKECLVKAANEVKPYLIKGVPELNLLPISPFKIPEIRIETGNDAVNFKTLFNDVLIYGFDSYEVKNFNFDLSTLKFLVEMDFGPLYTTSDYETNSKILVAPIVGKGTCTLNVSNAFGRMVYENELQKRKGVEYLVPTHNEVTLKFGKSVSHFEGLFDGNSTLAKLTNDFINENNDEITKEVLPALEKVMAEVFKDMLQRSIGMIPYDKLFPVD